MNKVEFAKFAMALKTFYAKETTLLPNDQALDLWYGQLKDLPYEVAEAVLQRWVATNKWSPSIADIREAAASITLGDAPDWGDAWESVMMAIRRFGMYQEAEALASLDEMTRTAVKRLGFRNICVSDNITADRANFRTIYEQLAERKKRERQMPVPLQELISKLQQHGVFQIEGESGNG